VGIVAPSESATLTSLTQQTTALMASVSLISDTVGLLTHAISWDDPKLTSQVAVSLASLYGLWLILIHLIPLNWVICLVGSILISWESGLGSVLTNVLLYQGGLLDHLKSFIQWGGSWMERLFDVISDFILLVINKSKSISTPISLTKTTTKTTTSFSSPRSIETNYEMDTEDTMISHDFLKQKPATITQFSKSDTEDARHKLLALQKKEKEKIDIINPIPPPPTFITSTEHQRWYMFLSWTNPLPTDPPLYDPIIPNENTSIPLDYIQSLSSHYVKPDVQWDGDWEIVLKDNNNNSNNSNGNSGNHDGNGWEYGDMFWNSWGPWELGKVVRRRRWRRRVKVTEKKE